MRRPMVAGNWKMNGSRAMVADLVPAIDASVVGGCDVLICPPAAYLQAVDAAKRPDSRLLLGAQDVNAEPGGAHTGELSASMLKDVGCSHVIVGHSERRQFYGDDDTGVGRKTMAALGAGLTPIVCVGESLAEREAGATNDVVKRQLDAVVDQVDDGDLNQLIIAYEPVWAIGTGKTATPEEAQSVHCYLREVVGSRRDDASGAIPILYGGSVKGDNAAGLFACPDIDGGLIGGASLKAEEFIAIIRAAANE